MINNMEYKQQTLIKKHILVFAVHKSLYPVGQAFLLVHIEIFAGLVCTEAHMTFQDLLKLIFLSVEIMSIAMRT